ncbi:MAG: hypothetical protein ABT20_15185 [Rubrivivax sp. SCN 70-15]|nr:MAG: hypothetical protein ABT20_15185 [Rubrivivax sp. SCN 70-15]
MPSDTVTNELMLELTRKVATLELRATILEQLLTSVLRSSGIGEASLNVLKAQRDAQAKTPEHREAYRVVIEMLSL